MDEERVGRFAIPVHRNMKRAVTIGMEYLWFMFGLFQAKAEAVDVARSELSDAISRRSKSEPNEVSRNKSMFKQIALRRVATLLFSISVIAGCQTSTKTIANGNFGKPSADGNVSLLQIAAETVPCVSVVPQRCLVVNGEFFYDGIEGYTHTEGQSASIYAERIYYEEPILMDSGTFYYRRVQNPNELDI